MTVGGEGFSRKEERYLIAWQEVRTNLLKKSKTIKRLHLWCYKYIFFFETTASGEFQRLPGQASFSTKQPFIC